MKLERFALVAEIVSAVAVVISLIFVGYQISQNTDEIRAANRQQVTFSGISATLSAAASPELAGAIAKIGNREELTVTERTQYGYFVRGLLYDIQNAYLLYLEGRLDAQYWGTRAAILVSYLQQSAAIEIYERDKNIGSLDSRFIKWLDNELNR